MSDIPEISVIMPVYNVEMYIEKAITSVLNQTFRDFEFLIVDDGSKDSSRSLIAKYEGDDRIRVITKANGGLSSARNAGLEQARGRYVTFLDSDDYLNEKYLEKLHDQVVDGKVDIAICNYRNVYSDEPGDDVRTYRVSHYSAKKHVRDMFGPRMIGAYAWGKLFRRESFDSIRFPEGRLYEDIFTIPYVMYPCSSVSYDAEPLYYYRQREGSILSTYKESRKDEVYAISAIVDYAIGNKDRLLCWYARINEVRSYLEIRHRFKKHGYDFMPVKNDFKGRICRDLIRILIPVF